LYVHFWDDYCNDSMKLINLVTAFLFCLFKMNLIVFYQFSSMTHNVDRDAPGTPYREDLNIECTAWVDLYINSSDPERDNVQDNATQNTLIYVMIIPRYNALGI
jgi:hypothetical protein